MLSKHFNNKYNLNSIYAIEMFSYFIAIINFIAKAIFKNNKKANKTGIKQFLYFKQL
ncbi:hypothetical protein [Mycoplasmopsis synoviae]|uniref:Uncharacterized protein n=1 Tax=Mycoplasmopsis synoviae TaxID=2109 RepID=A0A3B0P7U1_MYCSY|nr:hypothetical protein [Mycoplasmopsis synoviae]UBX97208.1 hypothetical protein K6989_02250 [Mycoplasmopsis synoviae]UBX97900.1 hypothetical protein K6987_02400 [Mycoplasmopsis synoviae]UBX99405.1 hypothetical protein K6988_00295 [Mycoplasmopsis synoviae]UBX99749.1 hypothetical protein K6990_01880 [Mycoplasmopsis synoviae]ULL02609.1 hypothetical protein JM201_01045 [Mycoplasmopsis synoviae]